MELSPTPELTVQALVAIISANSEIIPSKHPGFTCPTRSDISFNLAAKSRFLRVLDALACLCVSCPEDQVFSIGFQIDNRYSKLVITIAGNQEVKQDTIDYLAHIWAILKKLSYLHAGKQSDGRPPLGVSRKLDSGNPHIIPRFRQAAILAHELAKLVYVFTSKIQMKRIRKWWDPEVQSQQEERGLLAFAHTFQGRFGEYLQGKEGKLELLIAYLHAAFTTLPGSAIDWAIVIAYINRATSLTDQVLGGDDPDWCENLALRLAADPKNPFPLRRAITKLTSQHRHLRELLSFSRSRRGRLAFSLSTTFHAVTTPPPHNHTPLPTSATSWKTLLDHFCAEHRFVLRSDPSTSILTHYNSYPTPTYRVHSECALIAHYNALRTSSARYIPPFSYIGMSKPPCRPCQMWLSAFNARQEGPRFQTRRSDRKWYPLWTPPEISGWEPALKGDMERSCLVYLEMAGLLQRVSGRMVGAAIGGAERDGAANAGGGGFLDGKK